RSPELPRRAGARPRPRRFRPPAAHHARGGIHPPSPRVPEDTMTTRTLRRIAAAALALCTALPAWAQPGDATAVQMYTLRNAGSLEDQLKIVHDAGVSA